MFCPKCGKQLKDGAKFCSNCGAKIQATAPKAEPVQPEPAHHKKLEIHNEFLKAQSQPEEKSKVKVKEEVPAKKSEIGITTILSILFLILAAGITAGSFAYTSIAQGPLEPITLETVKAEKDDGAEEADSEETNEEDATEATEETEAASK